MTDFGILRRWGVLWLLAAALVPAAPLRGDPPRYFVGEITVQGGNALGSPVVFQQELGPDCRPGIKKPLRPISGYLGADVQLHVKVVSCPGAPPPDSRCRVQVGPAVQTVSFGWEADLPVPLPAATGVHRLRLDCTVEAPPAESFDTELYMTWKESVTGLGEQSADLAMLHKMASSWATGLTADSKEEQLLTQLTLAIYAYGRLHWHYGYGIKKGTCSFCDQSTGEKEGTACQCKCSWSNLIDPQSSCHSGDCFTVSAVLYYVAVVNGVMPGLDQTSGLPGLGLLTRKDLRSFDPLFPGDLTCEGVPGPCSYYFPTHAFAVFNGVRYDPTLGHVYHSLDQLIWQEVVQWLGNNRVLKDGIACFDQYGYGGWGYYRLFQQPAECRRDPDEPARFTDAAVESKPVSVSGDDRPELMGVVLEVEILREGSYRVGGALYEQGKAVAVHSAAMSQFAIPEVVVSGPPGRYRAVLLFSGEDLVRSEITAPLTLHAYLASERGLIKMREATVPPLPTSVLKILGEHPALIESPLDISARAMPATLRVKVPVVIREKGDILLQARLSSGGKTLAHASAKASEGQGEVVLTLDFPLADVVDRRFDGEYLLSLVLQGGDPPTPVDSLEAGLGYFRAEQFGPFH